MVATLFQHCNAVLRKNRRCESSRVTSPGEARRKLTLVNCCKDFWDVGPIGSFRSTTTATSTRTAKRNRFWLAKRQLCTCLTLFCTFLCHHCATTLLQRLISHDVLWRTLTQDNEILFLFLNFDIQSFIIQLQKKLPTFDGTERDGISAIKFDTFRLQSLSRSLRGEFFLVLRDMKEERRKKILS